MQWHLISTFYGCSSPFSSTQRHVQDLVTPKACSTPSFHLAGSCHACSCHLIVIVLGVCYALMPKTKQFQKTVSHLARKAKYLTWVPEQRIQGWKAAAFAGPHPCEMRRNNRISETGPGYPCAVRHPSQKCNQWLLGNGDLDSFFDVVRNGNLFQFERRQAR